MANKRLRKELVEGMEALRAIGAIDGATMRSFREDLLGRPPKFSAKQIRKLRERFDVSQAVFASLLNVSPSTVQKWEQGQKDPSAPALKLLQIVDVHGLSILLPPDSQAA